MDIKLKEVNRSGTDREVEVTFHLYDGGKPMLTSIVVNKDTAIFSTAFSDVTFTLEEIDMIAFHMRRIKDKIHYYGESFKL